MQPRPGKAPTAETPAPTAEPESTVRPLPDEHPQNLGRIRVSGLQYHINIVLPETRDQAVFDAIFKSLREHLG
jgi:hypothetical protein